MNPETVLFDLDSTLCYATQDDADIHDAVFDRVGMEPFFGPSGIREVAADVGSAQSDFEFFRQAFDLLAEREGVDADTEALAQATLEIKDPTAVAWRDGARGALELARTHATVGLVTNGGAETQRQKLDVLGLDDAFETVVYAGNTTAPKPRPEPFHTALDALDAVPESTLYVGNDYRSDVIGAKRAGLAACWVPMGHDLGAPADAAHTPDFRFDSPRELHTLF